MSTSALILVRRLSKQFWGSGKEKIENWFPNKPKMTRSMSLATKPAAHIRFTKRSLSSTGGTNGRWHSGVRRDDHPLFAWICSLDGTWFKFGHLTVRFLQVWFLYKIWIFYKCVTRLIQGRTWPFYKYVLDYFTSMLHDYTEACNVVLQLSYLRDGGWICGIIRVYHTNSIKDNCITHWYLWRDRVTQLFLLLFYLFI